jgi:carbamate kinase
MPLLRPELTVLALGGHALIDPELPPTVPNQFDVTRRAMMPVAKMLCERGDALVLTHGNGPQVGFMQLRSELASQSIHTVPLDSIVADTQGSLGYMIQRALREDLAKLCAAAEVVTVVTEVEVDPQRRSFTERTKPIGLFYTAEEAEVLREERGWDIAEDPGRGYRRVVPSPNPVRVLQLDSIARLVDDGVIVVACGGGGIPVIRDEEGNLSGYEAVIDKDRASALLAHQLGAGRLVITTAVDAVYVDWLGPDRRALGRVTVDELTRYVDSGEFPAGSMGPKVEAAIKFVNAGGREAIVCAPNNLLDALEGKSGTWIVRD